MKQGNFAHRIVDELCDGVVAAERAEEVNHRRVYVVLVGEPGRDLVDVVLELAVNQFPRPLPRRAVSQGWGLADEGRAEVARS